MQYGAFPVVALAGTLALEQGERLSLSQAFDGIQADFGVSDSALGGLGAAMVLVGVVGEHPVRRAGGPVAPSHVDGDRHGRVDDLHGPRTPWRPPSRSCSSSRHGHRDRRGQRPGGRVPDGRLLPGGQARPDDGPLPARRAPSAASSASRWRVCWSTRTAGGPRSGCGCRSASSWSCSSAGCASRSAARRTGLRTRRRSTASRPTVSPGLLPDLHLPAGAPCGASRADRQLGRRSSASCSTIRSMWFGLMALTISQLLLGRPRRTGASSSSSGPSTSRPPRRAPSPRSSERARCSGSSAVASWPIASCGAATSTRGCT